MTELQPSERPAHSPEPELIDSWGEAADWPPLCGAVPRSALIGPSQSIKSGSVPPPYKNQTRETSPIIFLPTTYAPTFSGFFPPLAWRGRTVGISVNARMSIGCQRRLTRVPPPLPQKKPLHPSALSAPPPPHHRQATDTRLAK